MTDEELYKKYNYIIKGSIEKVPRGIEIFCGKGYKIVSHGKIAIIKCKNDIGNINCLITRIVNIQDIKQTKYCISCTRYNRNTRRRLKRHS